MWRVTLILNALMMALLGLGSAVTQIRLRNLFIQYPEAGEKLFGDVRMLPAISFFALHNPWLYKVIPMVWAVGVAALIFFCRQRPQQGQSLAAVHTSATILIGMSMFLFFLAAGTMPFIPMVLGLEK